MATEGTGRNTAGKLYGLSAICPIRIGSAEDESRSNESMVRATLADLGLGHHSPLAAVANTYLARFFVLKDVFYESRPAKEEHLKSQYLVFMANFHGDLETYLRGMWGEIEADVRRIWGRCVAFDKVHTADEFIGYIKKCQVTNVLLFQGSTDEPLDVQLKSLYLKQEFGRFAMENQGLSAKVLRTKFTAFIERVELDNLERPTWRAGEGNLKNVVVS